jgi:tetratricopeptide (TPR) repeat protein
MDGDMDRREKPYDPFVERMQAKRLFDVGARSPAEKSPDTKTEEKGVDWPGRVAQFWKGVAIIYLSAIALWVVGYSLYDLATDFVSKRLVIEPIAVPRILADKGYTSEMAARQFRDALIEIRRYTGAPTEDVAVLMKRGDDLTNISAPGIGVPLESVATLIRAMKRLGRHPTVSGEVIFVNNRLRLNILSDGADVLRRVSEGDVEHPDRLFEEAAKEFLRQTDPITLSNYLAVTQPDKASELARSIIELRPETDPLVAKAHDVLGDSLRRYVRHEDCSGPVDYQIQLNEARKEYAKAIRLDPQFAKPHNGMGLVLAEKGDLAGAKQEFEKAISLAPTFAAPYNNLGVYRRRFEGRRRDPRALDEAVLNYKKAIEIAPQNGIYHYNMGLVLYETEHKEKAIKEYKKAVELIPSYPSPHISLGIALRDYKNLREEAIEKFDIAIKRDKCSALARYQKGATLHYNAQDADNAIGLYEESIRIDANYVEPVYSRGQILYCNRRDLDAAISSFQRASDLSPKEAWFKFSWSVALNEAGRLNDALKKIDEAIELNPREGALHNFRGEILLAQHNVKEARKEFVEAIALDSQNAAAYNNLAKIMSSERRTEEAIDNFRKAVEYAPDRWEYHADLGNILRDQGKDAEAEWEFETAHRLLGNRLPASIERQLPGRSVICSWRPRH